MPAAMPPLPPAPGPAPRDPRGIRPEPPPEAGRGAGRPGADPLPAIVFGAFDRHNLGDLLLAHVAEAVLAGRELVFAGLAARDLRAVGGHRVQALPALAARWRRGPALLWHAGGELLGCRAWQAALMLMDPAEAPAAAAYFARRPAARAAWARGVLGSDARVPYAVARSRFPAAARIVYAGVGGVGLAQAPPALQVELRATLADADALGVRDAATHAWALDAGLPARLVPDPASCTAGLFGRRIAHHAGRGEPAQLRAAFPQGWIAVQCSALFGDDATLDALAAALGAVAARTGLGIVFFRAGAAPWHDDLGVLRRAAARLGRRTGLRRWHVAETLHLWELCALIAHSRLCVASSLHARLVAAAFARPRVTLAPPARGESARKQHAVIEAWDAAAMPGVVPLRALGGALARALAAATPDAVAADRARAAALSARAQADMAALLAIAGER
jgi:hypothetical protein